MKVAVWDTYVDRNDGSGEMHFDILVSEELQDIGQIKSYGLQYLKSKGITTKDVSLDKCDFCHIEQATDSMTKEIEEFGHVIIELSNCD